MNFEIERPSEILIKSKIKPSHQRIKIYEYLASHFTHPTADKIFYELKKEMPTLSRSTIYSTLKVFVAAKLIREITIEDNEIRYEFNIQNHGHFKCEKCDTIYDFNINIDDFISDELNGFQINDKNVYFKGICKKCLEFKMGSYR